MRKQINPGSAAVCAATELLILGMQLFKEVRAAANIAQKYLL
jgi:hypothetical protein